ncbi:ribosome biogenesis GTPase Der [Sphingobacteriales bacterium UPWRP_1]|nr:ribosome biogenesis GTPase Der [Sphingobacteriales bacterium TSM_CSS]PSJ72040.1 ribosome biogenesis GTPase Der [Sphingobacteriales bacterium UPWRP_1]
MSFTVAIVGRPNVGKSTLFNRLVGKREAIVDNYSGVTRDRKYGESYWNGKYFNVVDTGGFVPNSDDLFEKAIEEQVKIAIENASLIVFLVDVTTGITDLDDDMARLLRRSDKTVLLVVNKVDDANRMADVAEFYSLGFDEVFPIASISGSGTGDLLDAIVSYMKEPEPQPDDEQQPHIPRFAIIGQPNVGKSSLVNALVGEARHIVTPIAGTTRDAIDTHYNLFQKEFILVDTAGIRKKAKVHENLEFYSVMRAINALDAADVCLLVIDAQVGIEMQDINIFRLAERKKKGVVILVNKWDAVEKDTHTAKSYADAIKAKIAPFVDVPIIFISALEKLRIFKAMEEALDVYSRRQTRISTHHLNEFLQEATAQYPPPAEKGKAVKIKYVTQLPLAYPTFAFFCNHPRYVKEAYRNYLENQLRKRYNFSGVPLTLHFRQK